MFRFLFTCLAIIFMAAGILGVYMFIIWMGAPLPSHPKIDAVLERESVIYPIILMVMGIASYLLWISFRRHDRGDVNQKEPLWIDRLTGAMKDSF